MLAAAPAFGRGGAPATAELTSETVRLLYSLSFETIVGSGMPLVEKDGEGLPGRFALNGYGLLKQPKLDIVRKTAPQIGRRPPQGEKERFVLYGNGNHVCPLHTTSRAD